MSVTEFHKFSLYLYDLLKLIDLWSLKLFVMDIDLLSKMVKELILDNDRVVLPGLGSFVAEIVPSTFSDKGYTINPPYRKLYFRSRPDEGSELATFYAKSNSVSEDMAERIIGDFISEMKEILFTRKTVVFPGLGRLRATKENNVFFVADEDLDIYPEGFGLEPISLKTHQETREEVSAAVADLKSILDAPEPVEEIQETQPEEPTVQEVPAEDPAPCQEEEPVEEQEEEPVKEQEVQQETSEGVPEETPVEVAEELVVQEEDILQVGDIVIEDIMDEPVEEEDVAESGDEQNEIEIEPEEETQPKKPATWWRIVLKVLGWILLAAVVAVAAYVAVGHFFPDWIDQFLYTPEELEILNYR